MSLLSDAHSPPRIQEEKGVHDERGTTTCIESGDCEDDISDAELTAPEELSFIGNINRVSKDQTQNPDGADGGQDPNLQEQNDHSGCAQSSDPHALEGQQEGQWLAGDHEYDPSAVVDHHDPWVVSGHDDQWAGGDHGWDPNQEWLEDQHDQWQWDDDDWSAHGWEETDWQ